MQLIGARSYRCGTRCIASDNLLSRHEKVITAFLRGGRAIDKQLIISFRFITSINARE